jgi:hypothetical protein
MLVGLERAGDRQVKVSLMSRSAPHSRALAALGFIRRQPRVARSIELLVDPKYLPDLLRANLNR